MRDFHCESIGPSGGCAVLRITGEIDAGTAPELRRRMLGLQAEGATHLLVDLRDTDFIDSTGLGVLVSARKRLDAPGSSLRLVITTERILRVFKVTGLTKVLPVHLSALDAITAEPHWERAAEHESGSVEEWCRQHGLT